MVKIYYADASNITDFDNVSEYCKNKTKKLKDETKIKLKVGCDLLLQKVLGFLPEIKLEEDGKPYLTNSDLCFNYSHSGHISVLAVSCTQVGIDIEKIRDVNFRIKEKYFKDEEIKNNIDLIKAWTKKESYLKYKGIGLKGLNEKIPDDLNFYFETIENEFILCLCTREKEYKIIKADV